jgi:ferric-dicitrate binding protein FerR (iron transport regulator)
MDRRELENLWPADEPPRDFAERVVDRALGERRGRRRPRVAALSVALVAAAALVVFWLQRAPDSTGDVSAKQRTELAIAGGRALAVLEPGAHVAWKGEDVTQESGDVFYRVEPGGRFVVKTPAGDVAVLGTCFRVRVGAEKGGTAVKKRNVALAAGAATLSVLAIVTVYEGKVQISKANEKLPLAAGESGSLGKGGAKRLDPAELDRTEQALAEAQRKPTLERANDALASDISNLDRKLHGLEKEKSKLQKELEDARTELARRTDAAAPRDRNDFDLDQSDWQELAKDGTIKYRVPCLRPGGWKPAPESLDELGLSPDDAATIQTAYQHAYDRVWKTIRPLCAKAIGNADVVDTLGPDTCTHVVVDAAGKQDRDAVREAMREVAESRAGLLAQPTAGSAEHPVFQLFWALTGEMPEFEAELAQSFGPEEAKRLAYAKELCGGQNTFGGPGPRKPGK